MSRARPCRLNCAARSVSHAGKIRAIGLRTVRGSLAQLANVSAGRRIYIHINNTNPMLREDSAERAAVVAAGWEIAEDGMEMRL